MLYCIQYNNCIHYIMYTVHCTVYSVQYTVYTVYCKVYSNYLICEYTPIMFMEYFRVVK